MKNIYISRAFFIMLLSTFSLMFFSCSDDIEKETITEDDYPRFVATKPAFPMKGENGELGRLNVSNQDVLKIQVLYTPNKFTTATWYIDDEKVGEGGEFEYSNETPGLYHLKCVLSTQKYETSREVYVNVYPISSGGEFSGFEINKGINIGNWLSQSSLRGAERENKFKESDVVFLSRMGFDHLRLPVDEEQLFDEEGEMDVETLALIHKVASWCQQYELRLIFDFHILRSHDFGKPTQPLWDSETEQSKFIEMWKAIHNELIQYPDEMLAYELLNEPLAPSNEDWNNLSGRLISELRTVAPSRMLILGSNMWNSVLEIEELQIPADDQNIMLTFHYYEPYLLTHYRASWTDFKNLNLPLSYPGMLFSDEDYNRLSVKDKELVSPYYKEYNRGTIMGDITRAVDYARNNNVKLYCGEFGCLPFFHFSSRYAWYRDMVSIFEETQTAYAAWEYNAIFGIVNQDGGLNDAVLLDILVGREDLTLTSIYSIEAEDCQQNGGDMQIQDNPAASGGKHINQFWADSELSFDVTVAEEGYYYLKIRYVCGNDVWMYVKSNNEPKQMIPCPDSGGWWSEFTDVRTMVWLDSGLNTLYFTPEPQGSPILDKFEVYKVVN